MGAGGATVQTRLEHMIARKCVDLLYINGEAMLKVLEPFPDVRSLMMPRKG